MNLIERVTREEVRGVLGVEVTPGSVVRDMIAVFAGAPLQEARVFAARISDLAMDFLVSTDTVSVPSAPEHPVPEPAPPAPAAPAVAEPIDEPAPADAVAETDAA
jgi:hypothetical protein